MPSSLPTVVLVEPGRHIRDLVKFFLTRAGFQVELAESGYLALDRVRRLGRAIIVTEIVVPAVDGLALCRLVKQDAALQTGVVVLSMLAAAERAARAGADAFLLKPINEELLVSTLNDIAARLPPEGRSTT